MQLETLVHEHFDRMSASDHIIWQYISQHREQCRSMSLHQLADACQVSHTTVLRFLQLLGMDGFGEFKVFLKWEEEQCPVVDERNVERTCFDLTRTVTLIEKYDCTELFRRLDAAANIYAYGSGSVQKSAAKVLKCFFLLDEKLVNVIEGREEREMALHQMQPGDVMFLLSVSGNNTSMNAYARQLRARRVSGLHLPGQRQRAGAPVRFFHPVLHAAAANRAQRPVLLQRGGIVHRCRDTFTEIRSLSGRR